MSAAINPTTHLGEAFAAIDNRKGEVKTRTLAKAIDIEIPDFLAHPGCRHNVDYDALRDEVLANGEGKVVENDTMLVDTGEFTGRCPKDRYIVDDGEAHKNVGWGNINLPIQKSTFDKIFDLHCKRLQSLDKVYVFEGFVGASKKSRRAVRVVSELAWHHHFCTNMFIRPTEEELENFTPDLTIVNSRAKFEQWKEEGLRSQTCVALDVNRGLQVVTNTEYSGEMKKGAFSMMNYLLPLEGIMSMHCSATVGPAGDTAIFFGLSGTGKTTLSADTTRYLIGDDEHGWDEDGVFNLEGGCYAKMVDLNPEKEPLIHAAICRDAILENVIVDADGKCDYKDTSKTENTRGSYPMWHIPNHLPEGFAGHPKNVIFLACDAYGVLPPVSKLTKEQALFHLVSGYTAKVAGTEMGITEPTATFSICFGGAFMPCPPRTTRCCSRRRSRSTTSMSSSSTPAGPAAPTAWGSAWTSTPRAPSLRPSSRAALRTATCTRPTLTSSFARPGSCRASRRRCSTRVMHGPTRRPSISRLPSCATCMSTTGPSSAPTRSWRGSATTGPAATLSSIRGLCRANMHSPASIPAAVIYL